MRSHLSRDYCDDELIVALASAIALYMVQRSRAPRVKKSKSHSTHHYMDTEEVVTNHDSWHILGRLLELCSV
ncbi:MAG: hypothetical protein DRJ40_03895 [Thermoprotei archaeon]|nr:MAG: hypothetical protein DRJ40_03895 [Thermoprotei archaeon]